MWETIELRDLRVFLVLAQELHFGRTAERLGLTTSRVSQSLRLLETKLGGRLLERTSRNVALTEYGEKFHAEIDAAYGALADVLRRAQAAKGALAGTLRLGLWPTATGPDLLRIVDLFEQEYPACEVKMVEIDYADVFALLRRGEVNVMCSWLPVDDSSLVVGPVLSREPRVLAVARDHPLAARDAVSLEDIADYRVAPTAGAPRAMVRRTIPTESPSGRPIRRLRPLPSGAHELITLIARGKIVHPTVPSFLQHFGHPAIVSVPIVDMPSLKAGLVWRRRVVDPKLRAFIAVAREALRERREASR